jgi:hypothetical protein
MIDIKNAMRIVWEALETYRENCIPERNKMHEQEWDDICTAMAAIRENLSEEKQA